MPGVLASETVSNSREQRKHRASFVSKNCRTQGARVWEFLLGLNEVFVVAINICLHHGNKRPWVHGLRSIIFFD